MVVPRRATTERIAPTSRRATLERRRPPASTSAYVHLHLGLDRAAQGGGDRATGALVNLRRRGADLRPARAPAYARCQFASFSFDVAVAELFSPLLPAAARSCSSPRSTRRDAEALAESLRSADASTVLMSCRSHLLRRSRRGGAGPTGRASRGCW